MAVTTTQTPPLHRHKPLISKPFIILSLLFVLTPQTTNAQLSNPPPIFASAESILSAAQASTHPTPTNPLSTTSTTPALPTHTDTAAYAPGPSHTSVLNYYFLLLAVFVVVLALVYIILLRRRRNRLSGMRGRRQSALERDLHGRWGGGRGRRDGTEEGVEGLDERGEAPPAYVKELEPVHLGGGRKPPHYQEHNTIT